MFTKNIRLSFYVLFFSICLILSNNPVKAQAPMAQPPIPAKRIYVDKHKKIYVNKSSPVYLRLTDSNDDKSKSYIMLNEKAKQENDPAYLDGHGVHHLVHNDAKPHGGHELSYAVSSDGYAPVTKSFLGGAQQHITASGKFFGKGLYFDLDPSDEMSGVHETMYSVNGNTFVPYTGRLAFDEEKNYNIRFLSYDNVGNMEDIRNVDFIIDLTPPQSDLKLSGTRVDKILAPSALISLSSVDQLSGVSRILYNFDRYSMGTYNGPLSLTALNDGEHTISYFSEDKVYNREKVNSFTFYLDKTAPVVKSHIEGDIHYGNRTYISKRTQISLTSTDNKAGVKQIYYKVNESPEMEYISAFNLGVQGNHIIKYAAMDNVKNVSSTTSIDVYLDNIPPKSSVTFGSPKFYNRDTLFILHSTPITISSEDAIESGVQYINYKVDNSGTSRFIDPIFVTKQGFHVLEYHAVDKVNNVEDPKKVTFFVDGKAPVIYWNFSTQNFTVKTDSKGQNVKVYPAHTILYLAATDHHSGLDKIFYSVNGGPEILYDKPLLNLKSGGPYAVSIRAVDKLGNESKQSIYFGIE